MKVVLEDLIALHDPLIDDSVVVDIGGYKGDYSSGIVRKYNSNVYVYEPNPDMYEYCMRRFEYNDMVSVFPYGLGEEGKRKLYYLNDGSTLFKGWAEKHNDTSTYNLVDIRDAHYELRDLKIGILKMNCEGSEYEIIPMIKDLLTNIPEVLVQFHRFSEVNSKYDECHEILEETHKCVYNFKWELWKRK